MNIVETDFTNFSLKGTTVVQPKKGALYHKVSYHDSDKFPITGRAPTAVERSNLGLKP